MQDLIRRNNVSFSRQEMLFEDLENMINGQSYWEDLINQGTRLCLSPKVFLYMIFFDEKENIIDSY